MYASPSNLAEPLVEKPRLVRASSTVSESTLAATIAKRKLLIGTGLCFCFMITEIVGGYLAHSLAIITDAAHMLSDIAGFLVGVLSIFLTSRAADPKYSFGYHIAEVLGAMVSISIVWLMTGILIYEACYRLMRPEKVDGKIMFWVSLIGVGMNGVLMFVLGHGFEEDGDGHHGHSHGHSHGPKRRATVAEPHGHSHAPTARAAVAEPHGHSHAGAGPAQPCEHEHGDVEHGHDGEGGHGHDGGGGHGHDGGGGHGHDAGGGHGHDGGGGHGHDGGGGHGHDGGGGHGHDGGGGHGHDGGGGHGHDTGGGCDLEHGHEHGHAPDTAGGHGHTAGGHGQSNGGAHEHEHGVDKGLTKPQLPNATTEGGSIAIRAAMIHVIGDILQSVGVCIAAACIWAFSDQWLDSDGLSYWYRIDPICTFIFSFLVLCTTYGTMKEATHVLMAGVPEDVDADDVMAQLRSIPNVLGIHDVHVWALSGSKRNLWAHLTVRHGADPSAVLIAAQRVAKAVGIDHTCFQVEDSETFDCTRCETCPLARD